MIKPDPCRYLKTNPEILRSAEMFCVRFPLSLRNLLELLRERRIHVSREKVSFRGKRFT